MNSNAPEDRPQAHQLNAAFGISPTQLAREINSLPLTARILTIDAVPRGYSTCVDITYYTQPKRNTEDA